jgi:hypothetical protein
MIGTPALVLNARLDMVTANQLGIALFSPVYADPVRPANNARFVFLDPHATEFFDGREPREKCSFSPRGKSWGKVYNYAWSGGMTIGPVVALVLLWDERGSTSFVLTAIGLAS